MAYGMDDADIRAIYARIRNWGRWGDDDELGTLNHIGPRERLNALALIREGAMIGCGNPLDTIPSPMNSQPAQHYMVQAGDQMPAQGPGVAYDFIGVFPHGQAQSHLDAMCHISHDGLLYGGRPRSDVTSKGANSLAISAVKDGICGRGVYLDIAASRGVEWIEPDAPIRPADLAAAEQLAGLRVGKGDILVYRTGRHERREQAGRHVERMPDGRGSLPGLHAASLEWLHEREVALIASDCAHDMLPPRQGDEWIPIHVGTEVYMGMLLLHNLELRRLSAKVSESGRSEFCFMVVPLNITGGTASPINPIAMF